LNNELSYYSGSERTAFDDILSLMFNHQYIKIGAAGLTPTQINEIIVGRISYESKPLLRPLAIKLEGGDYKGLLTEGLTEKPWHEGEEDEEAVFPIA